MPIVSIMQALADKAAENPDRPAITCGDETVTRRELESRTNRDSRPPCRRGLA